MIVQVKSEKTVAVTLLFSAILVTGVSLQIWIDKGVPLVSSIFLFLTLLLLSRYAIAVCRVFAFDTEGILVSFLWFSKKFRWEDLETKRAFDSVNSIGYLIPYRYGYEFYRKRTTRPVWMQPILYSLLFHPFSYIVVHLPIDEISAHRYLALYELSKEDMCQLEGFL